ncbi:hypothetical protein [Paenibacillus xylanexedens]|uniref:hypothetical protein n=1 Tax=Paenibacillus xylanexedens TaxID=528191 RepID=UPI0016429200|nr:hypothetical protein [Paenibacillus xylanexedens]
MKPLKSRTRKHSISSRSCSAQKYSSHHLAKNRSEPGSKISTPRPPASRQTIPRASVRGLSLPDRTSNQSGVIEPKQNTLDKLAFVAAILALIASAIGLYIAWKTLLLPSDTTEIVV